MPPVTDPWFLGGFAAGEGCFTRSGRRFGFSIALGATDSGVCDAFREVLGIGSIARSARRKPHYDDEVTFIVRRLHDLIDVAVPFMDEHLPPSYKRIQYEQWRAELTDYWNRHARRRKACAVGGCRDPQRAKDLCRRHYYEQYGR